MPYTRSSSRMDGERTIWRLVWRVPGNGIRWMIRTWIPTRSPTPSRPCSINSSARAGNRSGSRPTPTWCAGSSSCTGSCPERWVTLRDVYRCTIDADLFAAKIQEAETLAAQACQAQITISCRDLFAHKHRLDEWDWRIDRDADQATVHPQLRSLQDRLAEIGVAEYDGMDRRRRRRRTARAGGGHRPLVSKRLDGAGQQAAQQYRRRDLRLSLAVRSARCGRHLLPGTAEAR